MYKTDFGTSNISAQRKVLNNSALLLRKPPDADLNPLNVSQTKQCKEFGQESTLLKKSILPVGGGGALLKSELKFYDYVRCEGELVSFIAGIKGPSFIGPIVSDFRPAVIS